MKLAHLSPENRLRPASLDRSWHSARAAIGRPELHFHDLRHACATWLAVQGATTKEIMARVGHSSPQVVLRYQHATEDSDAALAGLLGDSRRLQRCPGFRRVWEICGINPYSGDPGYLVLGHLAGKKKRAGDGNRTRVLSLGS